jgi:hypothetical protein
MECARLIRAGNCPEADSQPIPAVDGHNGERPIDQFLLREALPHCGVELVRCMVVADERDRFSPGKCRPLPIGEERRFPPGRQGLEALLRLTTGARILRVHVDTEGTPVELGGTHAHQF